MKAAESWSFGIESEKPFLVVIFTSIVFLGMELVAILIDKLMYVTE